MKLAPDKVMFKGLKSKGVEIIELIDSSWFLIKFWRLFLKYRKIRKKYDVIMVGYLSNQIVPWIKLITKKKILYNAVNSMYESIILDRELHKKYLPLVLYYWIIDFLAFYFADLILVESNEQRNFIAKKFKVKISKLKVNYIGADDQVFFPDQTVKKREKFTVVFRGGFLPATGVEYVIEAAKILRNMGVNFLIIGRGMLEEKIKKMIRDYDLRNIKLVTDYLPAKELRKKILSCHICLGQFADHPRLGRTIQNKTYEALALGMPYITRDSLSNREMLRNGENCLFVKPADANDLANRILELKNNPELREKIAKNGYDSYDEKFNQKVMGNKMIELLN